MTAFYLPAKYRPADRGRTWRDVAPDPVAPSLVLNVAAIAERRSPVMAPASCVTVSDRPCGCVELTGRDKDGIVRFTVELERDPALIRWWSKAIRLSLAMAYDTSEAPLKLLG